jgi:hypothetical protein
MKYLITLFTCFAACFSSGETEALSKVTDIQVEAEYKAMIESVIANNYGNLESFVDLLEIDDKRVLVATVAITNKRLSDPNNAKVYLDMLKVSAVKGKAAIVSFMSSNVRTESSHTRRKETTTSVDSEGKVSKLRKASSTFESFTEEESELVIKGARPVGSWYSADRTLFYRAIVVELPSKK